MIKERDPNVIAFGIRLRELRLKTGMTQDQLSARTGLHRVTISKLETGVGGTRMDSRWKLAEALNVEVAELVDR